MFAALLLGRLAMDAAVDFGFRRPLSSIRSVSGVDFLAIDWFLRWSFELGRTEKQPNHFLWVREFLECSILVSFSDGWSCGCVCRKCEASKVLR